MRNLLYFFVLAIAITSCQFHEPVFLGEEKVNLEKIDGQTVKFQAGGKIQNDNWFGIKVKPSDLELYVDDDYFGMVRLDKKIKIKRKSANYVEGQFTGDLEKGALMKAMKLASKGQVKVRLKGKVKGGVFIFSKKLDVDKTKTISTATLRKGL